MKLPQFTHLHLHTEYSPLDGLSKVEEVILRVKELGMESVAFTDHASMGSLYEAQKLGQKHGIKVIQGCEFYHRIEDKNAHIIVLAKNKIGLKNMHKLHEYAYVEGFYKKPNISMEKLIEWKEGLIVSTACLGSELNQLILKNEMDSANEYIKFMKHEFGEDFYIEVQSNSIAEQEYVNRQLVNLANKHKVKYILTNDIHYTYEDDAFAHEVLLGLQHNKKFSDEKRYKFPSQDFWIKSPKEVFETTSGLTQEEILTAMSTTQEIVDKCNSAYQKGKYLPKFWKQDKPARKQLAELINEGSKRINKDKDKNYMNKLQYELNIIDEEGYCDYYLIVQDYINIARNAGILVGDGRGSGSGSKVAYAVDISRIDPEEYGLLFERFMAKNRSPDFDVDFSDQNFVFNYLRNKYGVNNVARIVAYGTLAPKAASRKVLSFFEKDKGDINTIAKLIPDLCKSMEDAYSASPDLLKFKSKYPIEFGIIERLQNRISHESTHAGGLVIYEGLNELIPLKSDSSDRSFRTASFDKYMLEELGFYKFDILGLITLPIIHTTLSYIKSNKGIDVDLYSIDKEDSSVYDMLCEGDVSGIFQLNNQQSKVMQQKPRNFKDLIAINALIRPGVCDWNEYIERRETGDYEIHPLREKYIKETMGLIAYQEQYMLDAQVFAGWDLAYADKHIRKNKYIRADLELRDKFYEDSTSRGHDKEFIIKLWEEIVSIVEKGYGFNKSHSASYAVISFQTAWLKHYYPVEFYAAMMSYESTSTDGQIQISSYIKECKKRGIKILPPDLNKGSDMFIPVENSIMYKLNMISDLGDSAYEEILKLRPFLSFDDFMERRTKSKIKDNVIVKLIKAGCFDFSNPNRQELMIELLKTKRNKTQIKQDYIPEVEYNDKIKNEWEKDSIGVYLTKHPLSDKNNKEFSEYKDNETAYIWVMIDDIKTVIDKNKNEMAFITTSTEIDVVRIVCFKDSWKQYKDVLLSNSSDKLYFITGRKDGSNLLLSKLEE